MEPYGTPIIVCIHGLKTDSSFILWYWFERQLLLSLRLSWSAKPQACRLAIIKLWGRQSDALERSISIVATRYGKTRVTSYELWVTSWKLKSTSWNSKVQVQIHELRVQISELRVRIHKLRVLIHKLRVRIHELRAQIHELQVRIHENH